MQTITLTDGIVPDRCDKILSEQLALPRSLIKASFEHFPFERNGKKISIHEHVRPGDTICFQIIEEPSQKIENQNLTLSILFEDDDIIVIDKPAHIIVHPAPGIREKTLVEYVLDHCQLSQLGDLERPGVVHRLDRETTGCIVFAKSNRAFNHLSSAFFEHTVQKQYTCIVHGNPTLQTGKIEIPIARKSIDKTKMIACPSGKYAKTTWTMRERFKNFSWIDAKIYTGRTHQIRIHMEYIGHPIAGDVTYGKNLRATTHFPRIMLHAEKLAFNHPGTDIFTNFQAPVPQDFQEAITVIKNLSL